MSIRQPLACLLNVTNFAFLIAFRKAYDMKDLEDLRSFLSEQKEIVITTHANPDADALGSSLALYYFLKSFGHHVYLIVPNEYPDFLEWMLRDDEALVYENDPSQCDKILDNSDILFCLDFSGFNRIKLMASKVQSIEAKVALIDHHLNPDIDPDFNFWDDSAAATAEIVYDFIVAYKGTYAIDCNIAEFLYAGIMTDTGSFKHPSTTSKIHRIVAQLIDKGANVNKVSRLIYDTNSINRLRFLGYALSEKLIVNEKFQVGYFVIGKDDFNHYNIKQGDTEGLVNYALSVRGIAVAAIIIERDDEIKLSFRSVGDYAVNTFAKEYFNGGGHKNAAGGSSTQNLQETVATFKLLIEKNILKTRL